MSNRLTAVILVCFFCLISCGTSIQLLPEPAEKKNLLIGSIIFDINGYKDTFLICQDNVEVAIIGRYMEDGRFKNFGRWVTTDENGYFCLANIPEGEYAIKGFQVYVMGLGDLKIINDLHDPQNNYYELRNEDIINFGGDLFDTKNNQRIVNLKHNIFTIFNSEFIEFTRYDRLRDYKLSTGEIFNSHRVPAYFIEKYEESGWVRYLELQF
jgi:hypothetical protein